MTRNEIKETLVQIIIKVKKTIYNEEIEEDFYLGGDMGVTSVEMLECMFVIQKTLNIQLDDTELQGLYQVKDVIDLVENKLS